MFRAPEIYKICQRMINGIDCDQDESSHILGFFDAWPPLDTAPGRAVGALFPLEQDQWLEEVENGGRKPDMSVECRHDGLLEAARTVAYHYHQYVTTTSELQRANSLIELNNAHSDMESWLPGYDWITSTMPWERGEDEEDSTLRPWPAC